MHVSSFIPFLPLFLFSAIRLFMPSQTFEMDFDQPHGTFISLYGPYAKLAGWIFAAGLPSAFFSSRIPLQVATLLLTCSALHALLFAAWLLYQYERYLHARYPKSGAASTSSYSSSAYTITLALGLSALVCFCLGELIFFTNLIAV